MLSRPGPLPSGSGWSFEVKWDGFRALVSTMTGCVFEVEAGTVAKRLSNRYG